MLLLTSALAEPAPVEPPADPTAEAPPEGDALPPEIQALVELDASLTYEHGAVRLAGNKVQLDVPEGFGYLDPKETSDVLVAWGNLPNPDTLGSLFPTGVSPFAQNSWGAILNYVEDGHVSDEDAAAIDYDDLLKEMQASDEEENRQRKAAGLLAINLAGWAAAPHYDAVGRKLHWAKRLTAADGGESLNYDIRILGREGVLSVQAVAAMADMPAVQAGMVEVLQFASFTEGNRYEDFDPSTDRLAEAGIAALILGGAAAASKGGFFKGLLALLLAGKKLIVPAVIALFAGVRALFGKKEEARE